jgi:hypothetical protein
LQTIRTVTTDEMPRLVMQWLQRTNDDGNLSVLPQQSANLAAPENWTTIGSVPADQGGVPGGFQRREVSVPMTGEASFLRLRVTEP